MTVVAALPEVAEGAGAEGGAGGFGGWSMRGADPADAERLRGRVVGQAVREGKDPAAALRGLGFRPPRQQAKPRQQRKSTPKRPSATRTTRRPSPAPTSSPAGPRSAPAPRAPRTARPQLLPSSMGTGSRLLVALIAGLVTLELVSLVSGRFFRWDLGAPWKTRTAPLPSYAPLYGTAPPGSSGTGVFGTVGPATQGIFSGVNTAAQLVGGNALLQQGIAPAPSGTRPGTPS